VNPGDRVRETSSGRLAFLLYESNVDDRLMLVRFDGSDFNTLVTKNLFEVLPSAPFRPESRTPAVKVRYHVARWPYNEPVVDSHTAVLYETHGRWLPPTGGFVDEITIAN
jgi:hypothetical protein